ncbi:hypothetical protein M8J77_002165 [Diaphorina citri]|nr:hypothetical protein M8J77_002165 [Diaphorina citri]
MEADSNETCFDLSPDELEPKIISINESGYSSSPFLMQIALSLAYNGYKIVMLSKDKFDMETNLNCIQGPPAPLIHPESAKNITFLHKIANHETLLEWLFSLSNKTTSLSVLIIDKLDQYFTDVNTGALLLAVLRHTVNTYHIKLILSLSQHKYSNLVSSILSPDKILHADWEGRCVVLRDEKIVLQYETDGKRIKLSQLLIEQVKTLVKGNSE